MGVYCHFAFWRVLEFARFSVAKEQSADKRFNYYVCVVEYAFSLEFLLHS